MIGSSGGALTLVGESHTLRSEHLHELRLGHANVDTAMISFPIMKRPGAGGPGPINFG